jgi:dihydroneopterin aldolase
VVVRGLELEARIGAYVREREAPQRVRIDLELDVETGPVADDLAAAVSYDDLISNIRGLLAGDHVQLTETLAERIADLCLDSPRAIRARVRVLKPDAVAAAEGVGAEVVKSRVGMAES